MADLADIFEMGDVEDVRPKQQRKVSARIAESLSEDEDDLESRARAAALIFDDADHKRRAFEVRRAQLMAKVEEELEPLRAEWETARDGLNEACKILLEEMEEAGIGKIPMADRKPIILKTTAGRKRPITRKWLTEAYGKQRANEIWGKAPNYPDKKEIVIPPRFDDEPSN
jgi:hypothetical protein